MEFFHCGVLFLLETDNDWIDSHRQNGGEGEFYHNNNWATRSISSDMDNDWSNRREWSTDADVDWSNYPYMAETDAGDGWANIGWQRDD